MTVVIRFQPGLKPTLKHAQHDQSTHGNWAGTKSELSDDEYRDIVYSAKTVEQAYTTIAKRLGKNMKAKEAELSEDEINFYRGVTNVERDTKRLLDGKIKFTEFQTWGQGIYVDPTKERASDYGTVLGLKLDKNAKIVKGETKWSEAVEVSWQDENARVPNTWSSDFIDMNRIKMNINDMGNPSYSVSDLRNLYWASKGYDGFQPHNGEMVLFNGGVLTISKNKIQKHAMHDQSTHGNWAGTAGEYPDKLWQESYDKANKAQMAYNKKLKSLGVPWSYTVWDEVGGPRWQRGVIDGEIKLSKQQTDELRKDQENYNKLEKIYRQIDKKWYDEHFDSKNKNPDNNYGMDEEIAKIRDEYVVKQIGGVDVSMITNKALRTSGVAGARARRFDKMVETSVVKKPVVLWRGAILPQEMVDSMKKGSSFIDKGFQSTGEKSKEATFYASERFRDQGLQGVPVIFKMKVNKGVNAVDVGFGEIVVQRNTKMTVVNVKSGPNVIIDYDDIGKKPIYAPNTIEVEVEVDKA